jgi:quinolinate synthase
MVRTAKDSDATVFVVGTEEGMLHRLKAENPEKQFFSLGTPKTCRGMKVTRIQDVHQALLKNQYEIILDEALMDKARSALQRMLLYV